MSRSNMFANIENQFEFIPEEEISEKTIDEFAMLMTVLGSHFDNQALFMLLITLSKIGVASESGELNEQEKKLADTIFEQIWNGDKEIIYNLISEEVKEEDFGVVKKMSELGNQIAFPMLKYILGFAYIDKKVRNDIMEKLDGIFGMNLITDFFESGLDEVPKPALRLEGEEADIVKWFKSHNELKPFDEIAKHFADISSNDLKRLLDGLCDKGILMGGDQIAFCMYGLIE